MYKFILDLVYPSAPKPSTSMSAVQGAIIEALIGHLYRLGRSVEEVRVPGSLVPGEPLRFVSSYGQFRVVAGLDVYGANVVTSALTGTNDNTASATVAADTVAATSDDDLVKLIASTVMGVRDPNGLYPADRAFKIANAVFDVLRAEGSVR
ncbi:hypothetical protein [Methylorubrum thiocyanatum]|uniref:hypothetical protein n=1 Tax=Methylorubrum thiocyanatum TaxID=47958 RepID=UPI003F809367